MNIFPIFRLAIFLAAGIFFAEKFRWEFGSASLMALLFLLIALGLLLKRNSYASRWVFGACVSCFMFLVGVVITECAWNKVRVDWESERKVYQGMLQDTPVEKQRTYQCLISIAGKEVLLYLPKDSSSACLGVGDELLFSTRIDSPENRNDSLNFDYACYLYHKGISGTAYVPANAWKKMATDEVKPIRIKALLLRERMIERFRCWGIGEKQLPVLSALTLGYNGDLDKETRDAYSVAGISHVLALSGMHMGILWFLLNGLLRPLSVMHLKWLKSVSILFFLWTFAFMVGLEASVVRAVVMCMLMELSLLSGGKPLSMNSLSIAAFFMLLYHPFYLYDVGFQLSFVAVASILFFYSPIYHSLAIGNRMGRWIWGMMSVSIAAQLGTAPLVMYYFSSFSVYFLLTNLIAAILVPIIIYGAVLMVMFAPWVKLQSYVIRLLNGVVSGLNQMVEWTSEWPYATFSLSVVTPIEILLFYVMLAGWMMYYKTRRRKWVIVGLVTCVCLLSLHLFILIKDSW